MLFLPYKISYSNYKISGEYIKNVWLFPTYDICNYGHWTSNPKLDFQC